MSMRPKTKRFIGHGITYTILIVGAIFFLLPIAWMISTSLKSQSEIVRVPITFIPDKPIWRNYYDAVTAFPILIYIRNTVFIVVVSVFGTLLSSTLVAYAFSRLKWPGRDAWFMVLLATMMLPGVCTMIPSFIMFKNFGWLNTYLPFLVPAFTAGAGNVFLIRQFFTTIPKELSESAKIDGAGHLRIYSTIILPLCSPVVVMIGVSTFMYSWNDFQGPLLYLSDQDLYTITYGLRTFQSRNGSVYPLLMAAALAISAPTIILFLSCQRFFIEGIVMSGLKG